MCDQLNNMFKKFQDINIKTLKHTAYFQIQNSVVLKKVFVQTKFDT